MDYLIQAREIFASKFMYLMDSRSNGELISEDEIDKAILQICHVNNALGGLNSQVKLAEDSTKVVVKTDLRRLANDVW